MKLDADRKFRLKVGTNILGTALAMAVAGALAINTCIQFHNADRAYAQRKAAVMAQYKAHPDRYRTGGLPHKEADALMREAESAEAARIFGAAGLTYARLGDERARAMADSCNRHGQRLIGDSILVEFYLRWNAARAMDSMIAADSRADVAAKR